MFEELKDRRICSHHSVSAKERKENHTKKTY
jgi:hypothetical protein